MALFLHPEISREWGKEEKIETSGQKVLELKMALGVEFIE